MPNTRYIVQVTWGLTMDTPAQFGKKYECNTLREARKVQRNLVNNYTGADLKHACCVLFDVRYGHVREVSYIPE